MQAMAAMALQSVTGVFGLQIAQIERKLLTWSSSFLPRGCGTADLRMIVRHGMNRLRLMPQETALEYLLKFLCWEVQSCQQCLNMSAFFFSLSSGNMSGLARCAFHININQLGGPTALWGATPFLLM